jgi:replicative DNA helicase
MTTLSHPQAAQQFTSPGRVPPQNLEAEQSVLGSILIDNGQFDEIATMIEAHMFYQESHRTIFTAIRNLLNAGRPADLVTLVEALRVNGELDKIGGTAYLAGLSDAVPTAVYIKHYAEIVREKSGLRAVIANAGRAMQMAYDQTEAVDSIIGKTMNELESIAEHGTDAGFTSLGELMAGVLDDALNDRVTRGIPTGFAALDECLLGLHAGEMIIVAGASSSGKTAFGLDVVLNAAVRGHRVAVYSLEMPNKMLVTRALTREARVDMQRIRGGTTSERDKDRLRAAGGRLKDAGVMFDDLNNLSVADMKARFRTARRKHGVDLIVVDYLQLVEGTESSVREQQVAAVSRAIKASAHELQIPIVALSQINDEHRKRDDKKPTGQHDIRESKAIFQDADVVMFVHRHEYHFPGHQQGEAEIIVAKQRNGPLDTVKLAFHGQHARFSDVSLEHGLL